MTKIKRYIIDTKITGQDKWIGTDSDARGRTKNFTPTGLAEYFNSSEIIDQTNALKFIYDTVAIGDERKPGSFSFTTEVGATVDFSDISNLVFHNRTIGGSDYVDFMSSMVGATIMFQNTKNKNIFSYFRLDSFEQDLNDTSFYNCGLTHISSNGSISEDQYYFVSLLELEGGNDKNYVHNQNNAASTWNVTHNLGKYPAVSVVLSTGQQGFADVTYIDENNLTITLLSEESGKAYIN